MITQTKIQAKERNALNEKLSLVQSMDHAKQMSEMSGLPHKAQLDNHQEMLRKAKENQ
jgi:hypothetical protein